LKHDFIGFIENARRKRPEKFRHQFSVFLSCLGISIFLWLLVQLSKEYSYTVEYQLHYTQVPSSLRLVYFSDSVINVTIKVQGFEFFSEHFLRSRHRDVDISLKGIKVKADDDRFIGYELTRNISSTIIAESEYPLDIYSTSPDTLVFTFEKKNLKKFQSIKSNMITISSSKNKNDSSNSDTFRNLTTGSHSGKPAKQKHR